MKSLRSLQLPARGIAALLLASTACASSEAQALGPAPTLETAAMQYRGGELGMAFDSFAALANSGNMDAARVALFMHLNGPAMYGRYWAASPEQLHRWRALADAAERAEARKGQAALERTLQPVRIR